MQRKGFPICPYYAIRAPFRHPVPQERRGCENPLRSPGPLLRGLHPQHLYPRYRPDEAGCGGHHRRGHQPGDVRKIFPKKGSTGRENPVRCCPVLSQSIPVWVSTWVYPRTAKSNPSQKLQNPKKPRQIRSDLAGFGGDCWTRTSDLLRVKQAL